MRCHHRLGQKFIIWQFGAPVEEEWDINNWLFAAFIFGIKMLDRAPWE